MILQQYIQEVLFKQRVCVVPQLGTFSVQHFPAQYNADTEMLSAPREQVIFTQLWQDDGSCVEWIALKENLVPAVAQRKLEKYLEELKAGIQSGTPLVLPGIGQLQGDFTGNIHFHPEILPAEKEALDLAPIQRTDNKPAEEEEITPLPEPLTSLAPITPMMTEEVEETLEAVEESGFQWWWAGLPVFMIIIGVSAWWYISHTYRAGSGDDEDYDTVRQEAPAQHLPPVAKKDTTVTPVVAVNDTLHYFAVINEYQDSSAAAKYQVRQQKWNRPVIVYKRDSTFKAAIELYSLPADTARQLKDVKKTFGSKVYLEF